MKGLINIAVEIAFTLVIAALVMTTWDNVVPDLFKLQEITYSQSISLIVLLFLLKLSTESCIKMVANAKDRSSKDTK